MSSFIKKIYFHVSFKYFLFQMMYVHLNVFSSVNVNMFYRNINSHQGDSIQGYIIFTYPECITG